MKRAITLSYPNGYNPRITGGEIYPDLVVHRSVPDEDGQPCMTKWTVTDALTGLSVGYGWTRRKAVQNAWRRLRVIGVLRARSSRLDRMRQEYGFLSELASAQKLHSDHHQDVILWAARADAASLGIAADQEAA